MRLHLIDTQPELVRCWTQGFSDFAEVDIQCADILSVAHNTLVSPANSYGYMDGGIDRLYNAHFGAEMQRHVTEAISRRPEGYLPVGASLLVRTGDARIPYLIVAPTMLTPEAVPAAHAFRALAAVLRVAKQNADKVTDVYCPGLATGIGGVAPEDAAAEMAAAYDKWVIREGPLDSYRNAPSIETAVTVE